MVEWPHLVKLNSIQSNTWTINTRWGSPSFGLPLLERPMETMTITSSAGSGNHVNYTQSNTYTCPDGACDPLPLTLVLGRWQLWLAHWDTAWCHGAGQKWFLFGKCWVNPLLCIGGSIQQVMENQLLWETDTAGTKSFTENVLPKWREW